MIDVNKIPKTEGMLLAKGLLPILQEFYKNPENEKKFEIWLRRRKQKLILR